MLLLRLYQQFRYAISLLLWTLPLACHAAAVPLQVLVNKATKGLVNKKITGSISGIAPSAAACTCDDLTFCNAVFS